MLAARRGADVDFDFGKVRAIDGVRSTETFVYLKLRKQTYAWGVR